jgi:hypothetical protein
LNVFTSRGRVFLSYSSAQREEAKAIAMALRNARFDVFFDASELPPGGDYNARIGAAMRKADAVVFLLTPEFVREGAYTRTELAISEKQWPSPVGRVLPVVLKQTDLSGIPTYLKSVTLLEPAGNAPAEIVQAVLRLRTWSQRGRWAAAALLLIAAVAAGGSWLAFDYAAKTERTQALRSVSVEIENNARVVDNLRANTATLTNAVLAIAQGIRNPGIAILAGLFPVENIDPDADASRLPNLFNERMNWLASSGLLQNELELNKATAACEAIGRTVDATRASIRRLSVVDDPQYLIDDEQWRQNMDAALHALEADGQGIAALYTDMTDARRSYDRVVDASGDYLDAMYAFCQGGSISRATLSRTLAAERLAFQLLIVHGRRTVETNERLQAGLKSVRERLAR